MSKGENAASPTIAVISGPTASGKSSLALSVAMLLKAEIVNADSVQVYKGFDIGSSKPSPEDFSLVPHHLYSLIPPEQPFDAGAFVQKAHGVIAKIIARKSFPLVVGGTGLYIRSLLSGLLPVEIAPEVEGYFATRVRELEASLSSQAELPLALHSWLREIDPQSAERLAPTDVQRIKRAILVYLATNKSLAKLQDEHGQKERPYRALVVILMPDRNELYEVANARVYQMLEDGLIEETRRLRECIPLNSRAFDAIGYRHAGLFLDGQIGYPEMIDILQRDTRRFAKRQLTWWRNQPNTLGWTPWKTLSFGGRGPLCLEEIPELVAAEIRNFQDSVVGAKESGGGSIYYLNVEGYKLL